MLLVALVAASCAACGTLPQAPEEPSPAPVPLPEPTPATAGPPARRLSWTWSLDEEGVFRSWEDNEETRTRREDLADGMNRLFGVVTRGGVEAGLQLDVAFASPADRAGLTEEGAAPPPGATTGLLFKDGPSSGREYGVVLEKKFLRWRGRYGSLEAGDTYRALGRGLALSLVRNTELDIDTSLEGAAADGRFGPLEATAFAGLSNPQTVSTAFSNHLRRDARDAIGGGRLSWAGPVEVFAHAVAYRFDREAIAQLLVEGELLVPRSATVAGGGFSLPDFGSGLGDLYVEAAGLGLDGKDFDGEDVHEEGYGAYAASNLYLGPVTVTLEAKSYVNLELLNARASEGSVPWDYSTPPSLEKENVVNYNLAKGVNSADIHGGRAALSLPLAGGVLGRLAYARFDDLGHRQRDFSGDVIDENESIQHVYAGVEKRGEGRFFQATAGVRRETRLVDPSIRDVLVHADGDLLVPLPWGGASLELKGLAYRQTETSGRTGLERTYDVTAWVASVRLLRRLSVAGLVDTTTDDRTLRGIGTRPGNLSSYAFGAVEVTVEPTGTSVVRLFAGATQGGLKCSGGSCRVIPAFEGVRLEWLARF